MLDGDVNGIANGKPETAMFAWTLTINNLVDKELQGKTCYVPVCIGQNYHQGEKFRDELTQLSQKVGKNGTIKLVIADTLHRHNLQVTDNLLEDDAVDRAKNSGEAWLKTNKSLLHSLPNVRVHYWDEYREHENFASHNKIINQLFDKGGSYKNALHILRNKIANRFISSSLDSNGISKQAEQACENYLKEEDAVWLQWLADDPDGLVFYPNKSDMQSIMRRFECLKECANNTDFCYLDFDSKKTRPKDSKTQHRKSSSFADRSPSLFNGAAPKHFTYPPDSSTNREFTLFRLGLETTSQVLAKSIGNGDIKSPDDVKLFGVFLDVLMTKISEKNGKDTEADEQLQTQPGTIKQSRSVPSGLSGYPTNNGFS